MAVRGRQRRPRVCIELPEQLLHLWSIFVFEDPAKSFEWQAMYCKLPPRGMKVLAKWEWERPNHKKGKVSITG